MSSSFRLLSATAIASVIGMTAGSAVSTQAQTLSFAPTSAPLFQPLFPQAQEPRYAPQEPAPYASQRPAEPPAAQQPDAAYLPAHLQRQIVAYPTRQAPGTIVVDTANTYLYYVLGNGRAIRYGIGVGREGFTWSGVKTVGRKAEWPDWTPPAKMIERQPYLPRWVAGGPGNPLGARAMYLAGSLYRIHGTNDPSSIGKQVSSGCIRMLNEDVIDLYQRAEVGSKVVVLPDGPRTTTVADRGTQAPMQLNITASTGTRGVY